MNGKLFRSLRFFSANGSSTADNTASTSSSPCSRECAQSPAADADAACPTIADLPLHQDLHLLPVVPSIPTAIRDVRAKTSPALLNPRLSDNWSVSSQLVRVYKGTRCLLQIPKDYKFPTEFEWVKEPKFFFTIPDIIKPDKTTLKKMSFQEKYTSFRMQIEKRRVPWDRFKS